MAKHPILFVMAAFLLSVMPAGRETRGGTIGIGDFGPSATVQDFNDLGLPKNPPDINTTPIVIGGNTFTTDNGRLRYVTLPGGAVQAPFSGESLGTDAETGWIDVVLGTAALRAGGYLGIDQAWSATASFFDESDSLLGTVDVAGDPTVPAFMGWEADTGLIQRIRFADTAVNTRVIFLDNLTTEIPEPSTFASLLGMGIVGFIGFWWRRRKAA